MPGIHAVKADFFRALGHPARVRILELLSAEEHNVRELQEALGLDSSSTSQHLAALRRQGLVESHREGTSVIYRVKDARTLQLLEVARQIITENLAESRALHDELAAESTSPPRK